jgi:methylated-DNA-[protein]-cysteine S-methyltransferase
VKKLSPSDQELAAWLKDARAPSHRDALTKALDRLYAAGPGKAATARARSRVHKALSSAQCAPLYYGRLRGTPVGDLFVAVSDRGVVAVDFGPSEAHFLRKIQRRTRAAPVHAPRQVAEAGRQLRAYLAGRRKRLTLPIDLGALSGFQRQVLLVTAKVPRGQVSSYGQIARRIGRPKSARAVGQALGHNPVPILIPCHRILASDGSLTGYSGRGGIKTKEWLLRLEGAPLERLAPRRA